MEEKRSHARSVAAAATARNGGTAVRRDSALLPLPAVAFSAAPASSTAKARTRLASAWSATKRRIGTGNALFRDDSFGEPTETETDSGSVYRGQPVGGRLGRGAATGESANSGSGTAGTVGASSTFTSNEKDEDATLVNAVVVENDGVFRTMGSGGDDDERASVVGLGAHLNAGGVTLLQPGGVSGSVKGGTGGCADGTRRSDASSFRDIHKSYKYGGPIIKFFRWRVWPNVVDFFIPRFTSEEMEAAYQKESWYSGKRACLWAVMFLELNFVLTVALLPRPWSMWNIISNAVVAPVSTLPLIPMALWDWPALHRGRRFWVWQTFVFVAVLIASTTSLIDMRLCDYFASQAIDRHCGSRDFVSVFFYAAAPPSVALFALGQTRLCALGIFTIWFCLVCGTILPLKSGFIRNVINLLIFYVFLLIYAYQREVTERCTFTLRSELKVQWKAKQRAEHRERREADASKRFSNYIFHEVRVPLNTALLAVQNLHASGTIDPNSDHAVEFQALDFSLATMSTVLNDVLDFSRMERGGGFSSVSRPFSMHQAMQSIFTQLKLDVDARGLALETHLDPRIDEVAVKAARPSKQWPEQIAAGDGLVLGDEMRVRQVITNLTSNACKFTATGGRVTVTTKLLYPEGEYRRPEVEGFSPMMADSTCSDGVTLVGAGSVHPATNSEGLTKGRLDTYDAASSSTQSACNACEIIVVRIEVRDTGVGIRPRDTLNLFSAYVQTEVGKKQGGKGTGLGLSLCRQIVKLSGGRLGVQSKVGEGSTFWVELPFQVGALTLTQRSDPLDLHRSGPISPCPLKSPMSTPPSSYSDSSSSYRFMYTPASIQSRTMIDSPLAKIDERLAVETIASDRSVKDGRSSEPTSPPETTQPLSSPPSASSVLTSPLPPPSPSPGSSPSSLPGVLARATSTTSSSRSAASRPLEFEDGPVHVLIVDDDTLTRKLMTRMIERGGSLVTTAADGEQALELILAKKEGDPHDVHVYHYDIIFLDNQMPKKTGLEVVNALRALGRNDLVVGVTANAMRHDQDEYLSRGANHVLTKPVAEVDLRKYCTVADTQRTARKARPPSPILTRPPLSHFPASRDSAQRVQSP